MSDRIAWHPEGPPIPGTIDLTLYLPLADVIPFPAPRARPVPPVPPGGGGGRVIRIRLRREQHAA